MILETIFRMICRLMPMNEGYMDPGETRSKANICEVMPQ
jgi:hypothetical protein